jgi:putative tricarboxylic transport membrane protein
MEVDTSMKADRLAGSVTAVAGLALAAITAQIDILASQPTLSARFFPYVLAAILFVGGLALMLKPGEALLGTVVGKLMARRGVAFATVFVVYALTFRFVDFRLGTWAFVLATMWIMGSRNRLELIAVPVAVSAVTYLLFRHGFTVLLPVWI